MSSPDTVTVIGGSDGPTAIFISGEPSRTVIGSVLLIILLAVLLCILIRNRKR